MRKFVLAIALALALAAAASAQKTTVTATIVDPQGIPYANGSVSANLYPPGVSNPTVNGAAIGGFVGPSPTDDNGFFSMDLFSNPSISPAGTAWVFTICDPGVPSPLGFGNRCFNSGPITISGATLDLSATLNALALPLTRLGGPLISFPRWDQVLNPNTNFSPNFGGVTASFANGTWDFGDMTVDLPHLAGCITTSIGQICYDTPTGNWNINAGGANNFVALFPSGSPPVSGDLAGFQQIGSQWVLYDAGSGSGSSGTTYIQATITDLINGETLCSDTSLTPPWVNCPVGVPVNLLTTNYTVDGIEDRGTALVGNSASPETWTLGQISDSSGNFGASWFILGVNKNSGTVSVQTTAPSVFDSTGTQTETLLEGQQCTYLTDGSGSGIIYPKCSEPRITAGSGVTLTRSPYSLQISATGSGGTVTGTGTNNTVTKWTGASSIGNSSVTDDGTAPTREPNGSNTATNGNYEEYTVDTGGVTAGLALCVTANVDGSGRPKVLPCSHTATQPGAGFVGIAQATVAAAGTVKVCWTVNCTATFDNTSVALNEAILSVTTDGRLHDTGSQSATSGQPNFAVLSANSGAGTNALISLTGMLAQNPNGGGGNGNSNSITINGANTKKNVNFANGTCETIGTSTSGNTTTATPKPCHGISFTIGAPGGTALTAASTTTTYLADIPFGCTINSYALAIDAGTITVKFWKVAGGTAIPTSGNSINTSGVAISSGTRIKSTTLSDFTTTTVTAGDQIAMNVTAVATAAFVNGVLSCQE